MNILLTGHAGFIGFHVARRLIGRGDSVVGVDNVNAYYDVALKRARLERLEAAAATGGAGYRFVRADIADRAALARLFGAHAFDRVIHLAAQAGVRYSLENPHAYAESNLVGFTNILEACRQAGVPHLTFASTSSVYGANTRIPFSEHDGADHPVQFYAATKRANELMAHSYAHLHGLPVTGLRFFTVYGPWGRPDMAYFKFTRAILEGEPIPVYNHGDHARDFTYIDDIVDCVVAASDDIARPNPDWDAGDPDPATSMAPFRLLNVGGSRPVRLGDFIGVIENAVCRSAIIEYLPKQPGDMAETSADTGRLEACFGLRPRVGIEEGIGAFVAWYREFYRK